jgi:hypothetical protein
LIFSSERRNQTWEFWDTIHAKCKRSWCIFQSVQLCSISVSFEFQINTLPRVLKSTNIL